MSSVFSQKVEAVRDKIPESVLDTPWKRTLLLVVFLIGAIAFLLFFAIFGLLKGIFGEGGKHSHSYIDQVEHEQREKEYAEQELLWMMDEDHKRREPSVFNDY